LVGIPFVPDEIAQGNSSSLLHHNKIISGGTIGANNAYDMRRKGQAPIIHNIWMTARQTQQLISLTPI